MRGELSVTDHPSEERNSNPEDTKLVERMVERENMTKAYARVMRNKGSAGIDKMTVEELMPHLKRNWAGIKEELLNGTYKPKPVKSVEIPKAGGGTRQLGVPTVLDRLIQQALHQVLSPIFEPEFSDFSYGFRKGRSAHEAILQAKRYQEEGRNWVVDMDLEKFFDRVNHDILMARVGRKVKDKRIRRLIRSYLNAGVMEGGIVSARDMGTPQGSPISPLLSNILLDDLDKELDKRGHAFCRYADDSNIYVRSEKAGRRVLDSITRFVEKKLKLKVNQGKSAVARPSRRKFLGYSFMRNKERIKVRVPKESIRKIKKKLKQVFRQGRGRNLEKFIKEMLNPVIRGWINYYKLVETRLFAEDLDGWVRRKLRAILWRQWKRSWTRRCKRMGAGLAEERAVTSAFNRRGPWWNAGASHMNEAFPMNFFDKLGLVSTLKELRKLNYLSMS